MLKRSAWMSPFFVYDCPFAMGTEQGDPHQASAGIGQEKLWHVIVAPKLHVSTPFIFKEWDKINKGREGLTLPIYSAKLCILGLKRRNLTFLAGTLFNSLEAVTVNLHPEIHEIRESLLNHGARAARMSGSGPGCWYLRSQERCARVRSGRSGDCIDCKVIVAHTV